MVSSQVFQVFLDISAVGDADGGDDLLPDDAIRRAFPLRYTPIEVVQRMLVSFQTLVDREL